MEQFRKQVWERFKVQLACFDGFLSFCGHIFLVCQVRTSENSEVGWWLSERPLPA